MSLKPALHAVSCLVTLWALAVATPVAACIGSCVPDVPAPFVFEWTLDTPTEVALGLPPGTDFDFDVDWGDGSEISTAWTEQGSRDIPRAVTHEYDAGTYTVTVSGWVEAMRFFPNCKLTRVHNLGDVGWTSTAYMFAGCRGLTTVYGGDTSEVRDMTGMFYNAPLAEPDTLTWDVARVTSMRDMFHGATSAAPDVTHWDVSRVTDKAGVFHGARSVSPAAVELLDAGLPGEG